MLHPWNFALNMCLRYADSGVLIDLKRKKIVTPKIIFGRSLFLSIIFRLKWLISLKQWSSGQGCVSSALYKILNSIVSTKMVRSIMECKQIDKFSNCPFCKLGQVSQK